MKNILVVCFFQFFICFMTEGQTTKDYRATTTKYSDGTTLTLGGYGDPSQYSFSNKNPDYSDNTNSGNNNKSAAGNPKQSKKDEKAQKIEMIELGSIWTRSDCSDCKNEGKSRSAYKKFIELVNEGKYGEALDLKQNEVNARFTEENPDEMSIYRYYGLVIFCERQCKLKYPDSWANHTHDEGIGRATRRVNEQLETDLESQGIDINEYKLRAFKEAGLYEEAKKIYAATGKEGEAVGKASLIAIELHSIKPNESLILEYSAAIFEEKLKKINAYTTDQSSLRAIDEDALGSFLIEILYILSQVDHSIRTAALTSFLSTTYAGLKVAFITEQGKERLELTEAYFTEFGIQSQKP
jgi:hypothetical protein